MRPFECAYANKSANVLTLVARAKSERNRNLSPSAPPSRWELNTMSECLDVAFWRCHDARLAVVVSMVCVCVLFTLTLVVDVLSLSF